MLQRETGGLSKTQGSRGASTLGPRGHSGTGRAGQAGDTEMRTEDAGTDENQPTRTTVSEQ